MSDVISSVVIHAVEVIRAFHQCHFVVGESRETVAELGAHGIGIFAMVDGVCEPGNAEFQFAFGSFDVLGIGSIPGVNTIT